MTDELLRLQAENEYLQKKVKEAWDDGYEAGMGAVYACECEECVRAVARQLAMVWDEGYEAGCYDADEGTERRSNPYRREES